MNRKSTIAHAVLGILLLGATAPLASSNIFEVADTCPQSSGGGGFGGNTVSCTFACDEHSRIHIKVTSSDTVFVAGDAACGGAATGCTGRDGDCAGNSGSEFTTRVDNAGTCNAETDEFWTSYLRVDCWSAWVDPGSIDPEPWCVLTVRPNPPYPQFCIDYLPPLPPVCRGATGSWQAVGIKECGIVIRADKLPVDDLYAAIDEFYTTVGREASSSAHIVASGNAALGAVCEAGACWVVEPTRIVDPLSGTVRWQI